MNYQMKSSPKRTGLQNIVVIIFTGLLNLLCVFNGLGQVTIDEPTKQTVLARLFKTPLHFVPNQGQLDESVIYYAKSEGAIVYCTDEGLTFRFREGSLCLKFSENRKVIPKAQGALPGTVNYLIGNEPALWRTNIPTFGELVYPQVYPGIDLAYTGTQRRLKYTFYVQPGAHPNQILMRYEGIESLSVDTTTGELIIQTPWGKMHDAAPIAYQEIKEKKKAVDISFRLIDKTRVGFSLGAYDPDYPLVLDPGYSTYLGGNKIDQAYDIAADGNGNAYVTGGKCLDPVIDK